MKEEVTIDQVAKFLQVNHKSAIQRMSRLVKNNRAVKLNYPKPGVPARFLINMPLEDLLKTQKYAKPKMSPHVDWGKFCSDPFRLTGGARWAEKQEPWVKTYAGGKPNYTTQEKNT